MKMKRRVLSMLLAVIVLLTTVDVSAFAAEVRERVTDEVMEEEVENVSEDLMFNSESEEILETLSEAEVTRAEWLSSLAETFEMTVEEDCYPDNYFSDLDNASEYYYDVLLNVEFGVIDVEEGGEVRPDDPATREFAAHTLNYCLGYQVDESTPALCSDIDDSPYKEDLQIAVNRGWFSLVDGNFMPEQNITSEEAEGMLKDAETVLASMEVDTSTEKEFELADDVVVITKECEVASEGESESEEVTYTITVEDLQETIAAGTRFAIYQNEIPTVYVAQTVSKEGDVTTITANVDESGTGYVNVKAQDIVAPSILDVQSIGDAKIVFVHEETEEEFETAEDVIETYGETSKELKNIKLRVDKEVDFGDGLTAALHVGITNVKITYDVNQAMASAYAYLECDTEITVEGNFKLKEISDVEYVPLLCLPVAGVGELSLSVNLDINASLTMTQTGHLTVGVGVSKQDGARLIHGFHAKSFSMVTEGKIDIQLQASFGIRRLPIIQAYVHATAGATAKITRTEWLDDKIPTICRDFRAYIYAYYGYYASIKAGLYSAEYGKSFDIITEKNSSIRCVKHYDDGLEVAECARDAMEEETPKKKRYTTPSNSSWSGSYWSGGKQTSGKDSNSNVIATYEYSLNADEETITITKYNGNATSLIIPSSIDGYTVTKIGDSVFKNNTRIRSVVIPDEVVEIDRFTFQNCSKLSSVKLSKNLQTLGHSAFANCDALTMITIPKSLTMVTDAGLLAYNKGAFRECDGLKKVIFEEGTTQVVGELFYGCTGLEEIDMPNTITNIGKSSFYDCVNLKKVIIPDTVTAIGEYAFENCSNLSNIELSLNLQTLGHSAFANCDALTMITIPKSLTMVTDAGLLAYNKGAFRECDGLKTVIFEEGTTQVVDELFYGCTGLEEIDMPNTITNIGKSSFYDCVNLKKVIIPDTVTAIGEYAFENCSNLSNIELSLNLQTLGHSAFGNCDELTEIIIPKSLTTVTDTPFTSGRGAFRECDGLKTVIFEEGTTQVASNLFYNCTGLEKIEIPETITEIGVASFYGCSNLKEVTIPDSITNINNSAFVNCTSLQSITIPDSVTGMGNYVFSGCTSLEEVKLPASRDNITEGTFQNCTNLQTIDLPETVEYIRKNAFQGSGLTEIVLPDGIRDIEQNAFKDCASLASVTFSTQLPKDCHIRNSAFYNCDALTEVVIPFGVMTIDNSAFYDCDALEKVVIPNSITTFGTQVFRNCDVLNDVTLGSGITSIPDYTFADCGKLETITIPYNVKNINQYAFLNCTSLTGITIPQKTTTIYANAFSYPDKLTIYGVKGSYAETFANEQDITFVEKNVPATKVSLSTESTSLNKNHTLLMPLQIEPADFTDLIVWKSSDTSIATVDEDGWIKAVGVGTTTIKVVVGDVSTSLTLTVTQPVTSISLSNSSLSMDAGETRTLTASVYPSNANNSAVQWSSSDESIATVSDEGVVTAISKGSCTITVASLDGSNITRTCNVTVVNDLHIVETIEDLQSPHPYENNCTDIWKYQLSGAEELRVAFDSATCMEDGFDYLYILDGEMNEIGKYTGNELSGKTITVPGDTVYIKLDTDDASGEYGFKVVSINGEESSVTYTIHFDKNSTEATGTMDSQKVEAGSTALLNANQFIRENYTFAGWNTKADGTGTSYADGASLSELTVGSETSITLYAQWTKENQVSQPTADIPSGSEVEEGTLVTLSCAEEGAAIYYTMDGSEPTKESTLYTVPIVINENITIKAIACKEGYQDSETVVLSYAVVSKVTYTIHFDKNSSEAVGTMNVQSVESGSTDLLNTNQFTRDGYTFSGWNTKADGTGTSYADGASVSELTVGSETSITLYAQWTKENQVSLPSANIPSGSNVEEGTELTLTCSDIRADIYYTIDGSEPTKESTLYTEPIVIKENVTIKAIACREGYVDSEVAVLSYTVIPKVMYTITFDKNNMEAVGSMESQREVEGSAAVLKQNRFTRTGYQFTGWNTKADGTGISYADRTPIASIEFGSGTSLTLYAQWKELRYVAKPTANIADGNVVVKGTLLTISCNTLGAEIYYTTDGTTPSKESTKYTAPIRIEEAMTVKAIAVKEGYEDSEILKVSYEVTEEKTIYTFYFDKNSEEATGEMLPQTWTGDDWICLNDNAFVWEGYLFNGWNTKADGTGTAYRNGHMIESYEMTGETEITLYAQWEKMEKLTTVSANVINLSTVRKGTKVVLEHSLNQVTIRYTTDGTVPTEASPVYTQPFVITEDITILAIAYKDRYLPSEPVAFSYKVAETGELYPEDVPEGGISQIPKGLWIAGINSKGYDYTGKAIKPQVRVYDHMTLLEEKKDYTISYSKNTKANDGSNSKTAPSITVKGKGNYSGKDTAFFKINGKDINAEGMLACDISASYNEKQQKPVPEVYDKGKKLKYKKDYTLEYVDMGTSGAFQKTGEYIIRIYGTGNYTGFREVKFVITDTTLISKASVSKIKNQPYQDGKEIRPSIIVKYKGRELVENVDYTVSYVNNTKVGKGAAILWGMGEFSGVKYVNFNIAAVPLKQTNCYGSFWEVNYTGEEIGWRESYGSDYIFYYDEKPLKEGVDFTVSYKNNVKAGKATVIFTGINGYSGTVKKSFKITPYDIWMDRDKKIMAYLDAADGVVEYEKGGAKPKVAIMFGNQTLTENVDYKLSYKETHIVSDDNDYEYGVPTVVVKGKGNLKGSFSITYTIVRKDISRLDAIVQDVAYKNKAGKYKAVPKLLDTNGKVLTPGKDYEKEMAYRYMETTTLMDGTIREAGAVAEAADIVPAGTRMQVTVSGNGTYKGELTAEYRVVQKSLAKAKVKIEPQIFTGEEITLEKNQLTVTCGKETLKASDYEIVDYENNIQKGKAKVTLKGTGNYGGIVTASFKIKSKTFLWWK